MLKEFLKQHGPLRIKNLKELRSGFRPRWFRLLCRAYSLSAALVVIGIVILMSVGWGRVAGVFVVTGTLIWITSIIVFDFLPKALSFFGYWFPRLNSLAIRLDKWLERDLDWDIGSIR